MRKNQLKNQLKLGTLLFCISILFFACQKEDIIKPESLKEQPQLKIEIIHNPDFSQNRSLSEKISLFKVKSLASEDNFQEREIYIEQYDFTLDDEIVKFISYGEYHSYTFPIWREEDNGLVENLVLSKQQDGSYLAFIVSYELTEAEKEAIKDGQTVPNLDEKAIIEVLSLSSNSLERTRYVWTGEGSIYWDTVSNSCMLLDIDSSGETVAFNWQPRDCPSGYQYEIQSDGDGGQGGGGTSDTGSDPDDNGFWDEDPDLPPDDTGDPDGGGGNGTSGDGTGTTNDPDPNDPDDPVDPSDCLERDQNGNCIGDLTSPLIPFSNSCEASNKSFNSYYSQYSPFKVNLNAVRQSCDSISTNNVENKKFLCIYEKLSQSPKFKTLFHDTFGESENLNVQFKIVDSIPGANGTCEVLSGHIVPSTGQVVDLEMEIKIVKSYMENSSAIAVAKTILHESLHAYLILKHLNCNIGAPFEDIIEDVNDKSLGELLNYYYATACPLEEDHEFIFDHMLPTMSGILDDIRDDLIPHNHQQQAEAEMFVNESNPSTYLDGSYIQEVPWSWDSFYKYLSISGLHQTTAFANNIQNSPAILANYNHYNNTGVNSFLKDCVD